MGKRQIRSQEKHSEGRKIPYRSEFLEGQDEGLAFLRGKKEDWEMTAVAFLPFFCKVFSLRKRGIHESTSSSEMRSPGYRVLLRFFSSPFWRFII